MRTIATNKIFSLLSMFFLPISDKNILFDFELLLVSSHFTIKNFFFKIGCDNLLQDLQNKIIYFLCYKRMNILFLKLLQYQYFFFQSLGHLTRLAFCFTDCFVVYRGFRSNKKNFYEIFNSASIYFTGVNDCELIRSLL